MKDVNTPSIRDTLGLEDAFATYVFDESRVDLSGWNSTHAFFRALLEEFKPKLILELGVWKGMSSLHMAVQSKKLELGTEIVAIDTWLGSSAHLSSKGRRAELNPRNGYPTLYETFLANVHSKGMQDVIIPLPMDGNSAAYALKRLGVKADMIHIDASHEYDACLNDFRNYWDLLADDGVLLCDDYGIWAEVSRAVCQFAAEVNRPVWTSMAKAIICKDPSVGFDLTLTKRRKIKVL
ncbi:class I SAM-dependent methyltransferase [Lentibacter algarum]|uniref:class I SAM-dependent methyltransferase n=1 Tax=Lentibacter algarum TaxID=576131 RepID=UPI002356AD1D|nr:class I SAM-dependent methyltransferase [Lentibacter algarum]